MNSPESVVVGCVFHVTPVSVHAEDTCRACSVRPAAAADAFSFRVAPITAQNFISLVQSGFYDGLKFHRYVKDFVIQGGDPLGTGMGGSGKTIPLEVTPQLKHDAPGVVAMARSSDPDSASCQLPARNSARLR